MQYIILHKIFFYLVKIIAEISIKYMGKLEFFAVLSVVSSANTLVSQVSVIERRFLRKSKTNMRSSMDPCGTTSIGYCDTRSIHALHTIGVSR